MKGLRCMSRLGGRVLLGIFLPWLPRLSIALRRCRMPAISACPFPPWRALSSFSKVTIILPRGSKKCQALLPREALGWCLTPRITGGLLADTPRFQLVARGVNHQSANATAGGGAFQVPTVIKVSASRISTTAVAAVTISITVAATNRNGHLGGGALESGRRPKPGSAVLVAAPSPERAVSPDARGVLPACVRASPVGRRAYLNGGGLVFSHRSNAKPAVVEVSPCPKRAIGADG